MVFSLFNFNKKKKKNKIKKLNKIKKIKHYGKKYFFIICKLINFFSKIIYLKKGHEMSITIFFLLKTL